MYALNKEKSLKRRGTSRSVAIEQGVTKRCRLSLRTNSALVIRVQMRGEGGVAGSRPMSTAVHIMWHGAQINFGDLPPYLTYELEVPKCGWGGLSGCVWAVECAGYEDEGEVGSVVLQQGARQVRRHVRAAVPANRYNSSSSFSIERICIYVFYC